MIIASVDLETTGRLAGYHEIVQIGIVPLDERFDQIGAPFYWHLRPQHPERAEPKAMQVHRISMAELLDAPESGIVADWLLEWTGQLGDGRWVTPLAHGWPFESSFLMHWLGCDLFAQLFSSHALDGMQLAHCINQQARFCGNKAPFARLGLVRLCQQFGIEHVNAHDALADAYAEIAVYKHLLGWNIARDQG